MPLFNEGNTKQPKASKLVALKTQSYKCIISILIKTPKKNYLQCLGIKDYSIDGKKNYYVPLKMQLSLQLQMELLQL